MNRAKKGPPSWEGWPERRKGLVCYNCYSVVTIAGSINRTTNPVLLLYSMKHAKVPGGAKNAA